MKSKRIIGVIVLSALFCIPSRAHKKWTTHFAYNNVTQIAMGSDEVYAISDGSLYSVNKQSERVKVYNRQSGLHGTGITCIHYDAVGRQLLIGYGTGKIDILTSQGVQYVSALYDKDMTQRKTIYNITIAGRTAYLSTAYGVQTMDLREKKLVDSYWLRPGGEETEVQDVLVTSDSIYAFTEDSMFVARLKDDLVNYNVWKREIRSERIAPDSEKGIHYQDATSHWYAGHAEGIVRFTQTDRLTYKPEGPIVNTPYSISCQEDQVYMVAGGRWTTQNNTPGHVMRFDGARWTNITAETIKQKTGIDAEDFMNVAVDPTNKQHYFIPSYGTGLYEFRSDSCVYHTLANGVIGSAVPTSPQHYTRLAGGHMDAEGRLWFCVAGQVAYPVVIKDGENYHGIPLVIDGQAIVVDIPQDIVLDHQNEHYVWVVAAYKPCGLVRLDHKGTPLDPSDDVSYRRIEWTNQDGRIFKPTNLFSILQDRMGRVWLATDIGMAYIEPQTDFAVSDAIVQPAVMDENGENPLATLKFKAICQTPDGHIWAGSENMGVYELNEAATEILSHFTTENSAMSDNGILSLAANAAGHVFIGTSEGLVEYDPNGSGEGVNGLTDEGVNGLEDEGSMLRWRLHFSYSNPEMIAATPNAVFSAANGSLFSINRADDAIEYWNKSTGLNGTGVSHIAYDSGSERLIIAYENGQIDLLDAQGNVTQMPDISMKAGSIAVTINSICVGERVTYLAMPFGILVIQPRKGEVNDTYYIGEEASAIEVQAVVEGSDSLYAFSFDRMYKGALSDNLVDYTYWDSEAIPFEQVQRAALYENRIYVQAHDSLYCRKDGRWQLVTGQAIRWMHVSGRQLLVYIDGQGLFRWTEEGLQGLTNTYVATDAVYTNGEYWIAEESKGLVRLGSDGNTRFQPEGPLSNFGYRLQVAHDRLYVAPGGRWADSYSRQSSLSIYDGNTWTGIPWPDTWYYTNHDIRDVVSYAVDNEDPAHFFAATFGTGVFEFKDNKGYKHYDSSNSTLRAANTTASDYYFTRTDGAMTDEEGNTWILNATEIGQALHIRTRAGQWVGLRLRSSGTDLVLSTPTGIWTDARKSNWKWMMDQRGTPRLILLDDNGTPTLSGDDRCMARSSFVDQNGNVISPAQFRCWAQDKTNRIWIGTDKGILLIGKETDFFSSNACKRIIIPRNDGTGLGDYLLGDEQINSIAVDGGNRVWIGTANSGLYLMEDDTITVAHFTETNSLLPANNVQSIAIMPKTGEVFVGTDRGIASYRSDASEAQTDMKQAYAYPNPVRPDYTGMISICGLMENTVVNIIDAGGNLVCKTKSHGGTAVWDGKNAYGQRATPGVYTALCNAEGGHTVVKILVIR